MRYGDRIIAVISLLKAKLSMDRKIIFVVGFLVFVLVMSGSYAFVIRMDYRGYVVDTFSTLEENRELAREAVGDKIEILSVDMSGKIITARIRYGDKTYTTITNIKTLLERGYIALTSPNVPSGEIEIDMELLNISREQLEDVLGRGVE